MTDEKLDKIISVQSELLKLLKSKDWHPEVTFPSNMHIPEGAQAIDLKNLFDVTAGTTQTIIRFTAPQGGMTRITHYGVFNDGLLAANFDFIPTVNGRRIYVYHGDPLDRFRIYLGLAPDLGNDSLVHAPITLQPGQILQWDAVNRDVLDASMGVRVVGYFDRSSERRQVRWGG